MAETAWKPAHIARAVERFGGRLQQLLSPDQIEAFYHENFVDDQVRDYLALIKERAGVVVDVGGGCGFFAIRLQRLSSQVVRVLDADEASIAACRRIGVDAMIGDALNPAIKGDESIASFNLILHHLVGPTEKITRDLQSHALAAWRRQVSSVFVNEYIYESYVPRFSGRLIFAITKSRVLSWIGNAVAFVVPA